jgi:hypothetical protein
MIAEEVLVQKYVIELQSMQQIAKELGCSMHKVHYWMGKYRIKRRTISEAIYQLKNPDGDPFTLKPITTLGDAQLFGLGVGLYWGEGTKANKHSVRLGNTDPELLRTFIRFLTDLFGIDKTSLRFGLQIFTDININEALRYWTTELEADLSQFYKVHVTVSGSLGTYREKSKFDVVTVYFHNRKLRDILVGHLPR